MMASHPFTFQGTPHKKSNILHSVSALELKDAQMIKLPVRLEEHETWEGAVTGAIMKRAELAEIEERYGVSIDIFPDGETEGARMVVEASGPPPAYRPKIEPLLIEADDDLDIEADVEDEDEEVFFGREEITCKIGQALQHVHGPGGGLRLLAILGPSGSGKSSVARAGLLPLLRRQPVAGPWPPYVAVLTPGERPLEAGVGRGRARVEPRDAADDHP